MAENAVATEGTIPWDPIPEVANRAPFVDVVHLEERRSGSQQLVVDVASSWTVPGSTERVRGAWRLTFSGVFAYRMRQIGYEGNLPLTRPSHDRALWEMSPSNYLVECSAPNGVMVPEGYHVHHFVIWGGELYEIVASKWSSEPLPDEWARPFARQVPEL